MKRRTFIAGVAAGAMLPARALAQAPRVVRVGVLVVSNGHSTVPLLRDALRRRGLVEGSNLTLDVRDANGDAPSLPALAIDLVALKPDAIIAVQTPAAIAAKRATSVIPIVMAPVGDPIGSGLISNLARPGGNITGVSASTAEAAGKLVELIGEAIPGVRRIGVLANSADDFSRPFLAAVNAAARTVGAELRIFNLSDAGELEGAFGSLAAEKWQSVLIQPSLPRRPVIALSIRHGMPAISPNRPFAEEGGLMSYAGGTVDNLRLAAEYVQKIASGQPPGELPVQQPTRIELVLNLKTARAIGVEFPIPFIARADEVIE